MVALGSQGNGCGRGLSGLHWVWCIGRGPHLQLRQEPQGTSDFMLLIKINFKKQKITSFAEDVQKLKPLCTIGGNVNDAHTVENSTVTPQKLKNRINIWSSNSISGYTQKELKIGSQRNICIPMFIIALFTIAK